MSLDLAKSIFGGSANAFNKSDVGGSSGVAVRLGTFAMDGTTQGVTLDGSLSVLPMDWPGGGCDGARCALVSSGGASVLVPVASDWVVSRSAHHTRDAVVTTWASGRVEVEGSITKNHSGATRVDQLPAITEFKADASYSKAVVKCCNGDYTARKIFLNGEGAVDQAGNVFCKWEAEYTGAARINYYYDLR